LLTFGLFPGFSGCFVVDFWPLFGSFVVSFWPLFRTPFGLFSGDFSVFSGDFSGDFFGDFCLFLKKKKKKEGKPLFWIFVCHFVVICSSIHWRNLAQYG
jgi:hypothetical protein